MKRMTHERNSGIKRGYWSPDKKEDLVQRLAAYESTGLDPEEIMEGKMLTGWIPVEERLPECEKEVLIQTQRGTITTAMYEDGKMPNDDSCWCWTDIDFDYDEETDTNYIPAGWWEYRHFNPDDVYNNAVDEVVVAWMPLSEYRPEKLREGLREAGEYADAPALRPAT